MANRYLQQEDRSADCVSSGTRPALQTEERTPARPLLQAQPSDAFQTTPSSPQKEFSQKRSFSVAAASQTSASAAARTAFRASAARPQSASPQLQRPSGTPRQPPRQSSARPQTPPKQQPAPTPQTSFHPRIVSASSTVSSPSSFSPRTLWYVFGILVFLLVLAGLFSAWTARQKSAAASVSAVSAVSIAPSEYESAAAELPESAASAAEEPAQAPAAVPASDPASGTTPEVSSQPEPEAPASTAPAVSSTPAPASSASRTGSTASSASTASGPAASSTASAAPAPQPEPAPAPEPAPVVSVSITSASKSMIRFTTSGGQITLNVDYICPDGSTTPRYPLRTYEDGAHDFSPGIGLSDPSGRYIVQIYNSSTGEMVASAQFYV